MTDDGGPAQRLPGRVNAHTHLYSGLAPLGMPAPSERPKDFVSILQQVWWRLDRALDEDSLRAAARYYLAEALLAGTTTVIDHHESPSFIHGSLDVLAEEATALGIRAVLTYGATERNGGRDEARRGLAECERFVRSGRFPGVYGCVGLHASFTISDDTAREAGALARALGTVVHVHVAEAASDVEDARHRGYEGPLERLLSLGALPPGSIAAHGVWLSEDTVRRADDADVWLIQNPRSNANNRVGYPKALYASKRVAIGTDGYPSDLTAEFRALSLETREHGTPRDLATLPDRATGGAVLAARFDPDAARDIVVVQGNERPTEVTVAGRTVVCNGALASGDLSEIQSQARTHATRLWQRMAAIQPMGDPL